MPAEPLTSLARLLPLLLAVLWVHPALGQALPDLRPVQVKVEPTADGLIREGDWASLRVELTNRAVAQQVRLTLTDMDLSSGERLTWQREVELPQGGRKAVDLYWRPASGRSDRSLSVDAGPTWDEPFTVRRLSDVDVGVGVIGLDPYGVQTVGSTWSHDVPSRRPTSASSPRQVRVGLIPVEALPERAAGYGPLTWVVWPQADPSALSPEQLDALVAWVADGGHLLVTATDTWRRVASSPLARILPVELTGIEDHPLSGGLAEPVPRAVVRLLPDARRLRAGTIDDLSAHTHGLGVVVFLGRDPKHLTRAGGTEDVWRELLRLPGPDQDPWSHTQPGWGDLDTPLRHEHGHCLLIDGHWGNMWDWNGQLTQWLEDVPGVTPLPMSWLLLFSALYLFIIGPVDYLVLRLIRRQPWTWVTFPLTIALFSTVALVGTSWIKGNQAVMRRVEVVDGLPGGVWRGNSYIGLFAARKSQVRIRSGFDDGMVSPLPGLIGFMRSPVITSTEGPTELSYRAETWTLGMSATSWTAPAPGTITLSPDGRELRSHLDREVAKASLLVGGQVYPVGNLPAGGTAKVSPASGGSLEDWSSHQSNPWFLVSEYPELDHGHAHLTEHTVLLGSLDEPFEPISVEGLRPDSTTVTLVRLFVEEEP